MFVLFGVCGLLRVCCLLLRVSCLLFGCFLFVVLCSLFAACCVIAFVNWPYDICCLLVVVG